MELPPALYWSYNSTEIHRRVWAYAAQFKQEQKQREVHMTTPMHVAALQQLKMRLQGSLQRANLVVVAGGDEFDASKWISKDDERAWDLILIYYGNEPNKPCDLCTKVYRGRGTKWRLAWRFTLLPEWSSMRAKYSAIAFVDDDLIFTDVTVLNTAFAALHAFDLVAAQPSICRAHWSHTPYEALYQMKGSMLRFTNMIEIMAPIFEMSFFDGFIRPTLYNAYYGWGLDWVWPHLLNYPRNRFAVVDEVCIFHPPSPRFKRNSLYKVVAPYDAKGEEAMRFQEWEYYPEVRRAKGFSLWSCDVIEIVRNRVPDSAIDLFESVGQLPIWLVLALHVVALTAIGLLVYLKAPRTRRLRVRA